MFQTKWGSDYVGNEGIREILDIECFYTEGFPNSINYYLLWIYLNEEYAEDYVALVDFIDVIAKTYFLVTDKRGFSVIADYLQDDADTVVEFDRWVKKIKYAENAPYPAKVVATSLADGCDIEYQAKYVISTVSVGVLKSGDITFEPPLDYPDPPYNFNQYQKVFLPI